ncbi:MAG: glycosyltransferase [Pseudomonadota bacterium]
MTQTSNSHECKKILFVLPNFAAGGAERVMISFLNNMDSKIYEPHLLVLMNSGTLRNTVQKHVHVHDLGKNHVLLALPAMYQSLRSIRPDIVVSTMTYMNILTLVFKPLFKRTRFFVREAITPSYFMDRGIKQKLQFYLGPKFCYAWADKILSPAQVIFDEFHDYGVKRTDKEKVIYNPVDSAMIESHLSESNPFDESVLNFVCSGRLHPQKGFDRLLGCLPDLSLETPWHLTILGEGDQRQELEDLIERHNLHDHVTLQGHVSNPWLYYKWADCFLLPSLHEGLPNVALENLLCGTPVIATSTSGGIAEIAEVASNGTVQVVDSMDEFMACMEKAQKKTSYDQSFLPDRFKMSDAVRELEVLFL